MSETPLGEGFYQQFKQWQPHPLLSPYRAKDSIKPRYQLMLPDGDTQLGNFLAMTDFWMKPDTQHSFMQSKSPVESEERPTCPQQAHFQQELATFCQAIGKQMGTEWTSKHKHKRREARREIKKIQANVRKALEPSLQHMLEDNCADCRGVYSRVREENPDLVVLLEPVVAEAIARELEQRMIEDEIPINDGYRWLRELGDEDES